MQGLDKAMNRVAEYDETKKHLEFDGNASHITGCLEGFSTCSKHFIYSLSVIFTIPYTGKQSCKQSEVKDSYTYPLLLVNGTSKRWWGRTQEFMLS